MTSLSLKVSGCFSFKCLITNLTLSPHILHFDFPNIHLKFAYWDSKVLLFRRVLRPKYLELMLIKKSSMNLLVGDIFQLSKIFCNLVFKQSIFHLMVYLFF